MNRQDVIEVLNRNDFLKSKLFCRGFCITNNSKLDSTKHPFYNGWTKIGLCNQSVFLYHHSKINAFWKEISESEVLGLIGHAYNPFNGCIDERQILDYLAEVNNSPEEQLQRFNELTGTFILFRVNSNGISFAADAVGLQSVFYSLHKGYYYVSSHANLIGDLLGLEEDPFVTELKKARYFHICK